MGACLENDYHRRPHFDHIIHNFTKYGDRICWFSDKLFKHKISTTDFVSALKHLESEGSEKIDVTPTPPSRHDYSDFDLLPASPGNSGYNINEGNFESPSKRDRFAKIAEMRSYVSQKSYNGKSSFSSPTASQSGGGGGAGLSMSKRSIGSASNSMRDIHAHEKSSSNGNIMKSSSSRSLRGAAEVSGGGERVTKASGGAGSSDKKKQVQKRSKKAKCTLL